MKAGMDTLAPGTKMVLNSGKHPFLLHLDFSLCSSRPTTSDDADSMSVKFIADFYGFNPPEANLELIARFFEKYPQYSEKAFLVVKVCFVPYLSNVKII